MAAKEAHIFIVDQGLTTADCHSGRVESDLDWSLKYVFDKIATILSLNRSTLSVGVLGLRSDETNNILYKIPDEDGVEPDEGDSGYININALKELGAMTMGDLTHLQRELRPSGTEVGDAISAIVIAIEMIAKFTMLKTGKPGKFLRKIVLVTDGQGDIDGDQIDAIAERINELDIQIVVLGVDFDDPDYGFKEEDKPEGKKLNEELLKSLTDKCNNSNFGTMLEAIDNLPIPEVKNVKPFRTYDGLLQLGDYEKYPETAFYINVQRYTKIKAAAAPSASNFAVHTSTANGNGNGTAQSSSTLPGDVEMTDAPDLATVSTHYTYTVNDPNAPLGKKDVEREDLAKGYSFGRTAVPINTAEENVTKLESVAGFSIIGFIPSTNFERYLNMGESCITIAPPTNGKAVMALSSLVHALHELESYAVARIVLKNDKEPRLILLAPMIEPDVEGLIDVPIPFAEDVRMYRFPPLDRVITTSGATISKHRNLPSDDLLDAMNDYVDAMDLSTLGRGDEGQPTEYMPIDELYSPTVHRINQALRNRAINPEAHVLPAADILMQWSNPPVDLVSKTASELEALKQAADIKRVEPKKKGRRGVRDQITPLSGLNIEDILSANQTSAISVENAIPEFKQLLMTTSDDDDIREAIKQMGSVVSKLVQKSVRDSMYPRALENMRVMRETMMSWEYPGMYNDYVRSLKERVNAGELDHNGGSGKEFWFEVRKMKLGLVSSEESSFSDVPVEDAKEFYSFAQNLTVRSK